MKLLSYLVFGTGLAVSSISMGMDHKMQHGFILSRNDTIANHLVAEGHHSYQVTVRGRLEFASAKEKNEYTLLKAYGRNKYYLFQAQDVQIAQLPNKLYGHIVEMEIGKYEPKGPRVENAVFVIDEVLSSYPNPFFGFESSKVLSKTTSDDSCIKDCGRKCFDKPIFCGQW